MEIRKFAGKFTNHPLTPPVLDALGVIRNETTINRSKIEKNGNETTKFVIWTTDGYVKEKNSFLGELTLRRKNTGANQFQLNVEQIYYNADNVKHQINVVMQCQTNPIASPVSWKMESRFSGDDFVNFSEKASVNGSMLNFSVHNHSQKRNVSDYFTSDWSLFSALPQLPFDETAHYEFDLLEGLRRFRKNHRLVYQGNSPLHHFQQIGEGILPYDYWLNDDHQLLMVITGNRAYIHTDLVAEQKLKRKNKGTNNEE